MIKWKKQRLNIYKELELAYENDIVSIDNNDSEHTSDICSTFEGDDANNFMEMGGLIDFEEAYGNPKRTNE